MKAKARETRVKLMRMMHGYISKNYGMNNPHPLLHQLAVSEFEVESMGHLSDKELQLLFNKITTENVNWKKVEALGITRIPEMSDNQQTLVKKLQKELRWSNDYLIEIAMRRYGYLHWKYLTGREAWAYCNYLIRRKREKSYGRKISP